MHLNANCVQNYESELEDKYVQYNVSTVSKSKVKKDRLYM